MKHVGMRPSAKPYLRLITVTYVTFGLCAINYIWFGLSYFLTTQRSIILCETGPSQDNEGN
jgi:hypothetical protein